MEEKKEKRRHDSRKVREQPEAYDPFDRHEIIDGIRYEMKPSPILDHQTLLSNLHYQLRKTCHPDGRIIFAPMDVHLDENNVVQPDLIFILNENLGILKNGFIYGAPDLLVEILSPSTAKRDRIKKRALYERFRIKEYWIADPVHFTIERFVLEQDKLQLRETYGEGDRLASELFPCISISMDDIFDSVGRFQDN